LFCLNGFFFFFGQVFTCLTVKLGDNLFFFGSTPTSLDATAFGYLCAILYTPLPDPILSLLMQEKFPRLVEFVQRVLRDHLNVNVKTLDLPSERPMPKRGRIEQMKSYLPGIANYTFRIALVVGFSYIFWQAWKGSEQK
jgi:hypothetical protein